MPVNGRTCGQSVHSQPHPHFGGTYLWPFSSHPTSPSFRWHSSVAIQFTANLTLISVALICGHSVHSQLHPHFSGTHENREIPLSSQPPAQSGQCLWLWADYYSITFDNLQFSHLQMLFSTFISITCISQLIYSLEATCCRTDKSWFDPLQRWKHFFPERPHRLWGPPG
jgi:hypothetical protein